MRDEEYQPHQIAGYGVRAQPALVELMSPQLRLTQLGTVAAVLALAASLGAVLTFPDFGDPTTGSGWAVTAAVVSGVLLVITVVQTLIWRRAMADWKGDADHDLRALTRISWVAHLVSYPTVLVGLWACIAGSVAAGTASTAALLLAFALLFLLLAQVLAGVQFLRTEGPAGTIPGHLRRLSAGIQRRR